MILTRRWWRASILAARSAFWQIGALDEALAAAAAGCDAVIAQGVEAGGHVRGTTPLLTLLQQVIPAVEVPVVAAGGIATGAAVAEALNAGAAAARVGTRFLATVESGAHREYVAALLNATADDTVCTTVFDQGWPDAPHRVLRVAVDRACACADQVIGRAAYADRTWEVVRRSSQPPTVFISGEVSAMAMYAGSGVGDITDAPTAAIVLDRMTAEALPLLSAPPRARTAIVATRERWTRSSAGVRSIVGDLLAVRPPPGYPRTCGKTGPAGSTQRRVGAHFVNWMRVQPVSRPLAL